MPHAGALTNGEAKTNPENAKEDNNFIFDFFNQYGIFISITICTTCRSCQHRNQNLVKRNVLEYLPLLQ